MFEIQRLARDQQTPGPRRTVVFGYRTKYVLGGVVMPSKNPEEKNNIRRIVDGTTDGRGLSGLPIRTKCKI